MVLSKILKSTLNKFEKASKSTYAVVVYSDGSKLDQSKMDSNVKLLAKSKDLFITLEKSDDNVVRFKKYKDMDIKSKFDIYDVESIDEIEALLDENDLTYSNVVMKTYDISSFIK